MDFGIDLSPVDLTHIGEIQIQKISVGKGSCLSSDRNAKQIIVVFSFVVVLFDGVLLGLKS